MQTTHGVIKTTGAHAVIKTLKAFGVDVIFANPGTTEMPLISALDDGDGGVGNGSFVEPVDAFYE